MTFSINYIKGGGVVEQKCLVRSKRAEDWTEVFVSCGQFHSEVHFIASTREPGGLKFAQR